MKDLITVAIIGVLLALEGLLWVKNPMHIPATFVTARAFGLQLFTEPGTSMAPAVAGGRHVLVSSWPYWRSEPQAGDIVAFVYPKDPSIADLKRIVATGGSSVGIRDGILYVDDRPAPQPYLEARPNAALYPRVMATRRVPADSFFVPGDNRDESLDSRQYGFIARDSILDKLWP